jgi:flagellar hook-associated protein 2
MSSSTSSSTSSLFTPLQFTGISQYSSDFQSILSRATSIAELPVQQMQNNLTTIQQQETDLSSLGSAVSAVETALQTLGNLGSGQALSATSSDSNVVTAITSGSVAATSYSISNVTSLATAASETSQTGYSDTTSTAFSTTGTMKLVYGSNSYSINLASGQNNLSGIVAAINALGAGVTASVLTTGGMNGDYLSLTANSTGATTLQLIDDPKGANPSNVLTSNNQGSNTNFDLNGIAVSSPNTTVSNVIPGLTLNFTGKTSSIETVHLNVSTDSSQISSALQTLVSSYNTLATEETAQFGSSAGSLTGNSIIYQIRQAMSSIVGYQGSGTIANLSSLGIEMSNTGQMSFNQQTFASLSSSEIASGLSLLGSSTTGIGGLQQMFNEITDPTSGSIAQQESQWSTTATSLTNQISDKTAQIQAQEQTLNQQLQAADASVAELASQQSILTASITSLAYTSYGYNTNMSTSNSI